MKPNREAKQYCDIGTANICITICKSTKIGTKHIFVFA